jgi:hypothetical protein
MSYDNLSSVSYHRVCNKNNTVVPDVKQEPLTVPGHLNPSPVFSGVRIARSLVFCYQYSM